MLKQRIHFVLLENFIKRVDLEVFPSDGKVVSCRIELNSMNRFN